MLADRAAFIALHPEFTEVETSAVDAALAQAAIMTNATIFGDLTDAAHGWLTAHLLAADPSGVAARIVGKKAMTDGNTLYSIERARLEDLVGPVQMAGW